MTMVRLNADRSGVVKLVIIVLKKGCHCRLRKEVNVSVKIIVSVKFSMTIDR